MFEILGLKSTISISKKTTLSSTEAELTPEPHQTQTRGIE